MQNRPYAIVYILVVVITFYSCRQHAGKQEVVTREVNQVRIFYTPMVKDNAHWNMLVINEYGDTIQYKKMDSLTVDFRKWVINGKTRYGYYVKNSDFYKYPDQPYSSGFRVITDSNFNILQRITLKSHGIIDGKKKPAVEHHDFILLDDNHYIVLACYEYTPTNIPAELNPLPGKIVVTPVIQEVLNGEVVWQWVGCEYPELYAASVDGNNFSDTGKEANYLHVNSMFIDPADSNLVISCRNTNQVMKLNRKGNNIVWKLGGKDSDFVIPDTAKFLRQHDATFINNSKTMLLLDNGQRGVREFSRVLELDIDEANRKVTGYLIFNIPDDFIEFGGNVEKRGERYFIGGGSGGFIMEAIPRTGVKAFELQLELGSYRVYKYPEAETTEQQPGGYRL